MVESKGMKLVDNYWTLVTQTKFDLCFFEEHYRRSLSFSRLLTWGPLILTSIATLAWIQWNSTPWITTGCPIVIFVMQVIEIVAKQLPFDSRKQELRELVDEILPIFREIENDWRRISEGELSVDEINSLILGYSKKNDEIKRHYLKDDNLPLKKRIIQRASDSMQQYFTNYYTEEKV